jgi:hypothetical protein
MSEVKNMKISEKGLMLQAKFKQIKIAGLVLLILAAMSFVFLRNPILALVFLGLELAMEIKLYRCPHCNKMLDWRRKTTDDSCCPGCEKFLFRGL